MLGSGACLPLPLLGLNKIENKTGCAKIWTA